MYTVSGCFCQLTYEKYSCHSNCLHREQESSAKDNNKNDCYKIIFQKVLAQPKTFWHFLGIKDCWQHVAICVKLS